MPSEKIMIVDDEADVLDLCSRVLRFDGYQVTTASNGYEAIDTAQHEHFDLLLTDIKMPGMDGLEIAQTLKKSYPHLICVTMTGYSTIDMVIEALKLGVDEFITKPFTPKELSKVIAKALESERLRKENFRLHALIPLFELNKTLMGTVEVDTLLDRLLEIAQEETNADTAFIYLFDSNNTIAHYYPDRDDLETERLKAAFDDLARTTFEQGQQLVFNLAEPEGISFRSPILANIETQSIIATPLKSQQSNHGVLVAARHRADFAASDSDFLAVLSGQASIALENAHLFTQIQEAYEQLQMLDHMKSEFINIAAHELRTPLSILMGYAAVLEEDLEGVQQDYLSKITRNALRLRALVDDMLNLKHLESGKISLSRDEVELPEVFAEIIQDMSLLIDEKQLRLATVIPADFPPMTVDRQKLDLIIMNLMHNAIKFTPTGGQITFKAEADDNKAIMAISDTGIGIPPKELNRIFDRFYQVGQSLTREHGGIGLGLAITKGMVEVCGGTIRVTSEEAKGTTFTITLPLDNRFVEARSLKLD